MASGRLAAYFSYAWCIYGLFVAHVITEGIAQVAGIFAMPVCELFMSRKSGFVFNQSTGAIPYHSQLAKDIDV